ncbi:FAD/NAD(P)-binding protein [Pseudaestuariivita sp.]|uniref:FAD/NAD(P)-binding protein n=1 Tax=Pseudaestuariivita sp. TaxID=2211669 RepID=UPI004059E848
MPHRTHAIVGDGITAFAFLQAARFAPGTRILLIGPNADAFGRGVAYAATDEAPWRFSYLLNSPADDIDSAFAVWLERNFDDLRARMQGRQPDWLAAAEPLLAAQDLYGVNAPREVYGDYMEECVATRIAALEATGVEVERRTDTALTLHETEGRLHLTLASGDTVTADSVDIAPGGPSTLRIEGDDGAFAVPTLFGNEARIAEHITAGAEIFCVGGNASMLDTLRLCQSHLPDADVRLVACAPDGMVPPPLVPRLPRKLTEPVLSRGHATAAPFLAEVEAAIAHAKAQGDEMREIRAGFRAHFLEHGLSTYVTDPDEARRVPAALRFWLRGGTRDTILDFARLQETGQTRMLTGAVARIEHGSEGARVVIRDAEGNERVHETGFVVNCAGAGPTSRYDPLTEHLLAEGHLTRCPISRGLEVGPHCALPLPGVRYLSPAVSVVGGEAMAMPLYDAHMLRTLVIRACAPPQAA